MLYVLFLNFSTSLTTGEIQEKSIQEVVVTGNKTISRNIGIWHLYNDNIVANIDIVGDEYTEFDINFVYVE